MLCSKRDALIAHCLCVSVHWLLRGRNASKFKTFSAGQSLRICRFETFQVAVKVRMTGVMRKCRAFVFRILVFGRSS